MEPVLLEEAKLTIVRTINENTTTASESFLTGQVMASGDSDIIEVGFVVSSQMDMRENVLILSELDPLSMQFYSSLEEIPMYGRIYYQAYAVNEAGINYGSTKIVETQTMRDGESFEDPQDNIGWFGDFVAMDNTDWVFHSKLQWLYAQPDEQNGLWLWKPDHGWLWTQDGVWPFLYHHETGGWLYLVTTEQGESFFFDYEEHQYFPAAQEE